MCATIYRDTQISPYPSINEYHGTLCMVHIFSLQKSVPTMKEQVSYVCPSQKLGSLLLGTMFRKYHYPLLCLHLSGKISLMILLYLDLLFAKQNQPDKLFKKAMQRNYVTSTVTQSNENILLNTCVPSTILTICSADI